MSWQFDSNKPIYLQIVERLERDILSGKLGKGEKIPSVRELALEASVNPNTMQRAMQELENRGLVLVQRTAGRQVTEEDAVIQQARNAFAAEQVRQFIAQMKVLGYTAEQVNKIIYEEW